MSYVNNYILNSFINLAKKVTGVPNADVYYTPQKEVKTVCKRCRERKKENVRVGDLIICSDCINLIVLEWDIKAKECILYTSELQELAEVA